MTLIRRHPALLLLAAIVAPSVMFVACGGDTDGSNSGALGRGPVNCVPRTVRACRGPRQCQGEQSCMANGKAYGPCVCTAPGPSPDDAATSNGDATTDGPTSNDGSDGPTSNDASDDGPTSNDGSDGPTSNDASDDGPSSNAPMGNGPTPNAAVRNGPSSSAAIDDAPGNLPIQGR